MSITQKIITTYRTTLLLTCIASLAINYFTYTGRLSIAQQPEVQEASADYLTTIAADYGQPVKLKRKGK